MPGAAHPHGATTEDVTEALAVSEAVAAAEGPAAAARPAVEAAVAARTVAAAAAVVLDAAAAVVLDAAAAVAEYYDFPKLRELKQGWRTAPKAPQMAVSARRWPPQTEQPED